MFCLYTPNKLNCFFHLDTTLAIASTAKETVSARQDFRDDDIIIIIITLFKSQIILAEHECSTNWGDCKSNKSN